MSLLETYKAKIRDLYAREPARVNAAVVSAVTWVVSIVLGIVLSSTVVGAIGLGVGFLLPPLVAELTRPRVIPVAKIEAALPLHPVDAGLMDPPAERLTLEEALGEPEEPRQTPPPPTLPPPA